MPLWEQVKSNLVEWYSVAADKTEELAKIGVRRYDKFGISRDIERQFTELGSFVYNALSERRQDFLADPTLLAIVERIKVLEQDLRAKESEIEDIKAAHQQRTARTERAGAAAEVVYPEPAGEPPAGAPEPDPSAGGGNPGERD